MGLLIAIEGIDGSGKGTQAARLQAKLQSDGKRTTLLSFPRYQETAFGRKIGDFLNGRFGPLEAVDPFLVSLLFAGDRFESRDLIQHALATNDVVICDRYVSSNIAHQGAKVAQEQRAELVDWIRHLEHAIYQLPAPQLTVFLDIPVKQAQQLIAAKSRRTYTDQAADLQEADAAYLQRVRDVYLELSQQPGWQTVTCTCHDQIRSLDEITSDLTAIADALIVESSALAK